MRCSDLTSLVRRYTIRGMEMTRRNELVWRILAAATVLLMALLLFSHTYNDIVITTRHGMDLWDILFSGDFLDFYERNVTVSGNPNFPAEQSCAYNILVYIVFAIWNIPLVLLEKLAHVDVMNNMFCLAYSKLLVVAAMLLSARLIGQILKLLDVSEKDSKFFVYLYLTSTLMISVGFIISQYDILSVVFQLLGLKAFLEKKDRQFILWFGIAICFKYFALVAFIPLLVLRYKKVVSWILGVVAACVPLVVTKLPFLGASGGAALATNLFQMLLEYSRSELNIFVVLYIFCIVWCFFQNVQGDQKKYRHKAVWAVFAAYSAFFAFLSVFPYWSILLAPYIVLVIALARRNLYAGLLLETCGMAALVIGNMLVYHWCYFGNTMKSMLLSYVFGTVPDPSGYIIKALQMLREANFFPIFNSVFIACMCAMAYLAYPKVAGKSGELGPALDQCTDLIILRWMVTTVICLLPILSMFI